MPGDGGGTGDRPQVTVSAAVEGMSSWRLQLLLAVVDPIGDIAQPCMLALLVSIPRAFLCASVGTNVQGCPKKCRLGYANSHYARGELT